MNKSYRFEVKKKRPEEIYNSVRDYFKGQFLVNYAKSKSLMRIQEKITIRTLEILDLEQKKMLILDAGCGPGFASVYLKEQGYNVVALDIISKFLYVYDIKELNPLAADMCFLPFQPNIFDAIISISALQWIYRNGNNENMKLNLISLSKQIENVLKPRAKAVFQFYPKGNSIMEEIGKIFALYTNLSGNFIIDNPDNAKKRKIFLILIKNDKKE